jgi:hypothetical protein
MFRKAPGNRGHSAFCPPFLIAVDFLVLVRKSRMSPVLRNRFSDLSRRIAGDQSRIAEYGRHNAL